MDGYVKKRPDIVARKIHGTGFLIDITDNYRGDKCAIYEINNTGLFIWENINGDRSVGDLAKMLCDAITDDVDYEMVHNDVETFINSLMIKSFVEV